MVKKNKTAEVKLSYFVDADMVGQSGHSIVVPRDATIIVDKDDKRYVQLPSTTREALRAPQEVLDHLERIRTDPSSFGIENIMSAFKALSSHVHSHRMRTASINRSTKHTETIGDFDYKFSINYSMSRDVEGVLCYLGIFQTGFVLRQDDMVFDSERLSFLEEEVKKYSWTNKVTDSSRPQIFIPGGMTLSVDTKLFDEGWTLLLLARSYGSNDIYVFKHEGEMYLHKNIRFFNAKPMTSRIQSDNPEQIANEKENGKYSMLMYPSDKQYKFTNYGPRQAKALFTKKPIKDLERMTKMSTLKYKTQTLFGI